MERLLLAVVAEMLADDGSLSMPGFRQFRMARLAGENSELEQSSLNDARASFHKRVKST